MQLWAIRTDSWAHGSEEHAGLSLGGKISPQTFIFLWNSVNSKNALVKQPVWFKNIKVIQYVKGLVRTHVIIIKDQRLYFMYTTVHMVTIPTSQETSNLLISLRNKPIKPSFLPTYYEISARRQNSQKRRHLATDSWKHALPLRQDVLMDLPWTFRYQPNQRASRWGQNKTSSLGTNIVKLGKHLRQRCVTKLTQNAQIHRIICNLKQVHSYNNINST